MKISKADDFEVSIQPVASSSFSQITSESHSDHEHLWKAINDLEARGIKVNSQVRFDQAALSLDTSSVKPENSMKMVPSMNLSIILKTSFGRRSVLSSAAFALRTWSISLPLI